MILFYSGGNSPVTRPENVLKDEADIMLTYHTFHKRNKPDKRFQEIIDKRLEAQGKPPRKKTELF